VALGAFGGDSGNPVHRRLLSPGHGAGLPPDMDHLATPAQTPDPFGGPATVRVVHGSQRLEVFTEAARVAERGLPEALDVLRRRRPPAGHRPPRDPSADPRPVRRPSDSTRRTRTATAGSLHGCRTGRGARIP